VIISENNNFKPFSNWAWNYKISYKKSKSCTMPIPCPRETWLHLLNPLRTSLIASLTPQGNKRKSDSALPTSEALKPRREILDVTISADAVKPNLRARMTAKYHHCHLQHISPPDSLWTLYKELEGELAAEQYTRMEIREYIKDLQSHYKPSPAESSTKGPPIPEASYIAPSLDPDSDNMADTIRGERQVNKHVQLRI
jgi:hypothetical protein